MILRQQDGQLLKLQLLILIVDFFLLKKLSKSKLETPVPNKNSLWPNYLPESGMLCAKSLLFTSLRSSNNSLSAQVNYVWNLNARIASTAVSYFFSRKVMTSSTYRYFQTIQHRLGTTMSQWKQLTKKEEFQQFNKSWSLFKKLSKNAQKSILRS